MKNGQEMDGKLSKWMKVDEEWTHCVYEPMCLFTNLRYMVISVYHSFRTVEKYTSQAMACK
jgi:hypothetical protein